MSTALDPAKPLFDHDMTFEDERVSISDANLVDVIHTNAGRINDGACGLPEPLGHADFYPNGGVYQTGCKDLCTGSFCWSYKLFDLMKRIEILIKSI